MLASPTPYPYVGSYALLEHEGRDHLVRIQWKRAWREVGEDGRQVDKSETVVSFPLRDGASGTLRVDPSQLIDGTPLTHQESREFHDLDRSLAGRSLRTPKQKASAARRDALRMRMIVAPLMQRFLDQLRDQDQRRAA